MPGYRGQTFEKRATALTPNDWSGHRDYMIAIGAAVDRLEAVRLPHTPTDPPADTGNETTTD